MNGGITTHNHSDPVLRGSLFKAFRVASNKSEKLWKKTLGFEEETTTKAFEEITEFASTGLAPRREQLQQAAMDTTKEGYTVRIDQYSFGLNMAVSKEAQKFKQYREAIMASESIAESLALTVEIICADVYGNSFSTTTGLLPDQKPICSNAGKLPRGGTYSTYLGRADFSETSIEAALIMADKMPGGHGISVGVKGEGVVIPPEYRFEAKRILKSDLQASSSNNATNALKDEGLTPYVNRHLPTTSNWWLRCGGENAKLGLMLFWSERPNVEEVGMDLNKATVYSGDVMFGVACVNRRRLIGSDF